MHVNVFVARAVGILFKQYSLQNGFCWCSYTDISRTRCEHPCKASLEFNACKQEFQPPYPHAYPKVAGILVVKNCIMMSPHLYDFNPNNSTSSKLSPQGAMQAMFASSKEGALVCKVQSDAGMLNCSSHTKANAPSLITHTEANRNNHRARVGLAPCCQWRSHLSKCIVILQLLSQRPPCRCPGPIPGCSHPGMTAPLTLRCRQGCC